MTFCDCAKHWAFCTKLVFHPYVIHICTIYESRLDIISFIMDDNELISVCNNLKQLQQVMVQINSVVEGVTDKSLTERMTDMSYLESAQMHLMMAEISINLFYCNFELRFVIRSIFEKQGCRCRKSSNKTRNGKSVSHVLHLRNDWKNIKKRCERLLKENVCLFSCRKK